MIQPTKKAISKGSPQQSLQNTDLNSKNAKKEKNEGIHSTRTLSVIIWIRPSL